MKILFVLLLSFCAFQVTAQEMSYEQSISYLERYTPSLTKVKGYSDRTIWGHHKRFYRFEVAEMGEVTLKMKETYPEDNSEINYSYTFILSDFNKLNGGYASRLEYSDRFRYYFLHVDLLGPGRVSEVNSTRTYSSFKLSFKNKKRAERWLKAFDSAVNATDNE